MNVRALVSMAGLLLSSCAASFDAELCAPLIVDDIAAGYRSTCAVVPTDSEGPGRVSCWGDVETEGTRADGSTPRGVVWRGADAFGAILGCRLVALDAADGTPAPLIELEGQQSPVHAPPRGLCVVTPQGLRCDDYPGDGYVVSGSIVDTANECAVVVPGTLRCPPRHYSRVQSLGDYEEPLTEVEVTDDHICVVEVGGRVVCDRGFPYEVPATPMAGLDVGRYMWCGLSREDGSIICFGEFSADGHEPRTVDPPSGSFVEVTVGLAHACARTFEGRVACWGSNSVGQLDVPERIAMP